MLSACTSMPCASINASRSCGAPMSSFGRRPGGLAGGLITAIASGTAACACTSMVLTRRPVTETIRRAVCAAAGRAFRRSHPTNASPATAPAASARNALRVVMSLSVVTTLCTARMGATRASLSHSDAVRDLPRPPAHERARVRHEAGDQELPRARVHRALDLGHAVGGSARDREAVDEKLSEVPAIGQARVGRARDLVVVGIVLALERPDLLVQVGRHALALEI